MNTLPKYKYPLDLGRVASIFAVDLRIDGPESLPEYKRRVRAEFASYLWCIALLRHVDKIYLAHLLQISVRSMDRYVKEVPLPDTFLDYIYTLQTFQP